MYRWHSSWPVAAAIAVVTGLPAAGAFAQEAGSSRPSVLKAISVSVTPGAEQTAVMLEADGPLPAPRSGALDNPPRIYIDLQGVVPAPDVARDGTAPLVRRTRVALYASTPLTTRVVVDLATSMPYRVDSSARESGRLTILIGNSVTPPIAAAAAGTQPAPHAARRSAGPDTAYLAAVKVAVDRLLALRPLLAGLDRRSAQPADDLSRAEREFDALSRMLDTIKPPAARAPTHALLQRACSLGGRAAALAQDTSQGESASSWNSASAAAGALMFLDRAVADLGEPPPKLP